MYLSIVLDTPRCSFIICLHLPCCPSAILWAIISVHIDPVNGETIIISSCNGPLIEHLKRFPILANRNAASAIIFISRIAFVCASIPHACPNLMDSGIRHTMFYYFLARVMQFLTFASTTTNIACCQCLCILLNNISTYALAPPNPSPFVCSSINRIKHG